VESLKKQFNSVVDGIAKTGKENIHATRDGMKV
jgi:hypothetical protein